MDIGYCLRALEFLILTELVIVHVLRAYYQTEILGLRYSTTMSAKDAITGSAEDIIISTTTTGTMLTPEEQKEFSDLIDEYEDRSIALQQKIISLRRRMRNLINDHARNEKEIETLRKEVGELKVKLHAANAAIGGEEKAAGGFVVSVLLSRGRFAKRGFDYVDAGLEDMLEDVKGVAET